MLASGFVLTQLSPIVDPSQTVCLQDTFYGSKQASGLFPLPRILEYLRTKRYEKPDFSTRSLRSLTELNERIAAGNEQRWNDRGRLVFRGQTAAYKCKRPFPNPYQSDQNGDERLILPGYWRRFRKNFNGRFTAHRPPSLFRTLWGDRIIYRGIPGWQTLGELNTKRYGPHTISDLADFPDEESQEYYRRWFAFKVAGGFNSDLHLVEQHYGIETHGLDVTFDPAVALFFATHRFVRESDGKARYVRVDGQHTGVLYAFVFHDPPVRLTADLVHEVGSFSHIPPVRPIRQKCALRGFFQDSINEAVTDLAATFVIAHNFDFSGLPNAVDLFPNRREDQFYDALLEAKQSLPASSPYADIVEYAWA